MVDDAFDVIVLVQSVTKDLVLAELELQILSLGMSVENG